MKRQVSGFAESFTGFSAGRLNLFPILLFHPPVTKMAHWRDGLSEIEREMLVYSEFAGLVPYSPPLRRSGSVASMTVPTPWEANEIMKPPRVSNEHLSIFSQHREAHLCFAMFVVFTMPCKCTRLFYLDKVYCIVVVVFTMPCKCRGTRTHGSVLSGALSTILLN